MATIKNIIFDLGGVILNIDILRTQMAFEQLGLKEIEQFFRIGHASAMFKDYEVGALNDEAFVEAIRQRIGLPVSDADIVEAWNIMLLDFPSSRIELLEELGKHKRIFLLSNTNEIHLRAFQKIFREFFPGRDFNELFEKAYYSHEIRLRKPDLPAYELVLNENHLLPAETIFIDDAKVNVEAAERLGIKGFHLEPGKTILDPDVMQVLKG